MIRSRVREWVMRHDLLPAGVNIVAACSGGPDSLALVDLLADLCSETGSRLVVAHVDHGLRGEESRQDAMFVRRFCAERKLPLFCGQVDVNGEIRQRGGSLEEAARRLRYEYLRQVAAQVGGARIATGHHRDDQAETLLLNLLRGSGSRGLGAMRPQQGDVIRPLLCLTREEIESYCRQQDLQPRLDSSNRDTDFRRNRIRHELIPWLRRNFNPELTETLCRTAEILAAEQSFLQDYAAERLLDCAVETDRGYRLDARIFAGLPEAVQRSMIRNLLENLRGDARGIGFVHVEQIRHLFLRGRGTGRVKLPGRLQARTCYRELYIETLADSGQNSPAAAKVPAVPAPLACPGDTVLPELGITLRCAVHPGNGVLPPELGPNRAAFDRAQLREPLIVRRRQPGDLFRPLGAPGVRKLKELLIDLKIPCEQRDAVPLICDAAGILWVAGQRRSERAAWSADTREYIMLEMIFDDTYTDGRKKEC